VLRLNSELLGFDIDVDVVKFAHTTRLLSRGAYDPAPKLFVGAVAAAVAVAVFVDVVENKLLFQVVWKLLGACLDRLLRHVDCPVIVLDFGSNVQLLGLGIDPPGELVVTASFDADFSILFVSVIRVASSGSGLGISIWLYIAVFLGLGSASLFVAFVLLSLLRLIFQDEGAKFQAQINIGALSTRLAVQNDVAVLDNDIRLRILALLAENEFADKTIKIILKLGCFMSPIDNPTVVGRVCVGLRTQLESEILDHI
jgi:hypothetical protein